MTDTQLMASGLTMHSEHLSTDAAKPRLQWNNVEACTLPAEIQAVLVENVVWPRRVCLHKWIYGQLQDRMTAVAPNAPVKTSK